MDPNFGRPVVGECHTYSYGTYNGPNDTSPAVACTGKHTGQTVAVVTPPAGLKLTPKHAKTTKFFRTFAEECYGAADATLGGTAKSRAKTAYDIGYFIPSKAQLAQGARWIRCDLVLRAGFKLSPLPTPLLGSFDDRVQRCLILDRGNSIPTVCAKPHDYRSTKVVTLHGKKLPGVKALQRAATHNCALAPGHGWFATWPDATVWDVAHQHQLVCYRQTHS